GVRKAEPVEIARGGRLRPRRQLLAQIREPRNAGKRAGEAADPAQGRQFALKRFEIVIGHVISEWRVASRANRLIPYWLFANSKKRRPILGPGAKLRCCAYAGRGYPATWTTFGPASGGATPVRLPVVPVLLH